MCNGEERWLPRELCLGRNLILVCVEMEEGSFNICTRMIADPTLQYNWLVIMCVCLCVFFVVYMCAFARISDFFVFLCVCLCMSVFVCEYVCFYVWVCYNLH